MVPADRTPIFNLFEFPAKLMCVLKQQGFTWKRELSVLSVAKLLSNEYNFAQAMDNFTLELT